MGKFEIKKRKNAEFQFNLKASNGEIILTSEGYKSKDSCKNGIDSVKKNGIADSKFVKLVAKNGKFYFNLKAGNGKIVGVSEMYESEKSRDGGIVSVKKNAADAQVVDLTL